MECAGRAVQRAPSRGIPTTLQYYMIDHLKTYSTNKSNAGLRTIIGDSISINDRSINVILDIFWVC